MPVHSGSFSATLKDQAKTGYIANKNDMANTLDPMDIKQIITLHLDGLSNRKIGDTLGYFPQYCQFVHEAHSRLPTMI